MYISYLCSMYRYNFYEFYVFCALVTPFTMFMFISDCDISIMTHSKDWIQFEPNFTSWYQDILNENVHCYITKLLFICLPLRYADKYIL